MFLNLRVIVGSTNQSKITYAMRRLLLFKFIGIHDNETLFLRSHGYNNVLTEPIIIIIPYSGKIW